MIYPYRKTRPGLWQLATRCPACRIRLLAGRQATAGPRRPVDTWMVWCLGCMVADPAVYRTLGDALRETPGVWCA